MLILAATTDLLSVITSAAATIDVVASHIDCTSASPPVVSQPERTVTAITTAATTTIIAAPGGTLRRNVKQLSIRNKHATLACDVTVQLNVSATLYEINKVTLRAGEMLEYQEGIGWFTITNTAKAFRNVRMAADSVHATAATFADVTGLTTPVLAGKHYNFRALLFHVSNATTTGAQFAINGPAMTGMRLSAVSVVTGSVTAAAMSAPVADVVALDTAAVAQTTGSVVVVPTELYGWINPSADGTFAIRATSEVTVAAGLTVKTGSWLTLWEPDS